MATLGECGSLKYVVPVIYSFYRFWDGCTTWNTQHKFSAHIGDVHFIVTLILWSLSRVLFMLRLIADLVY